MFVECPTDARFCVCSQRKISDTDLLILVVFV